MHIKKVYLILLLFWMLAGCSAEATPNQETREVVITDVAQTVQAQLTASATSNPTPDLTATPSPTATVSPTPTISETPISTQAADLVPSATANSVVYSSCDVVGFVADVTIADDTEILGGTDFTKTWELRNDGTCTWTSDYLLVFYSGSLMNGPSSQQLTTGSVAPGGTIDISVDLTAPTTTGTYTGYWVLRNASGVNFGIGSYGGPFYLRIIVTSVATNTPTPTATSDDTATPTITATTANTATNTAAPTLTATPANTAAPTATTAPTVTSAPGVTPVPTDTPEPTLLPTNTPLPTEADTAIPVSPGS